MFIEPSDIIQRLFIFGHPDEATLIGEEGKFGRLVFRRKNTTKSFSILIHDEDKIMDVVEEAMRDFTTLHNAMWGELVNG